MKMNEKIEVILSRKRIHKCTFAENCGITYRCFANYLNGSRVPRGEILERIAKELDLTTEFLLNDDMELELTIEERFVRRACHDDRERAAAMQFISDTRGLFAGNTLSDEDKDALFQVLLEIYNDSRASR